MFELLLVSGTVVDVLKDCGLAVGNQLNCWCVGDM